MNYHDYHRKEEQGKETVFEDLVRESARRAIFDVVISPDVPPPILLYMLVPSLI